MNVPDLRAPSTATGILIILHLVGLAGLNIPLLRPLFESMVWADLLITTFLLAFHHQGRDQKALLFLVLCFGAGMMVEIAGVQSGLIFGRYTYTSKLGLQIAGVPLIIGLNWFLLIYCCGQLSSSILNHPLIQIPAGASLMVILDFFIEPFAIEHHLWVWHEGHPPLINYIAWFVISLPLLYFYRRLIKDTENRVAIPTFAILLAFFVLDWLIHQFGTG